MPKLVIDLSDEMYKRIVKTPKCTDSLDAIKDRTEFVKAIQKGEILQKGHGRLIDADALEDTMLTRKELINEEWAANESSVVAAILNTFAPTLIEADKEK